MDISGEKYIFLNHNLRLIEKNRGIENALNEAHAVQLQGGSASNMDQYSSVTNLVLIHDENDFPKILIESAELKHRLWQKDHLAAILSAILNFDNLHEQ